MKRFIPAIFILLLLATSQVWHGSSSSQLLQRQPASLWVGCMQAFRVIVSVTKSPWLGFIRRVPRPRLNQFDVAAVRQATENFVSELQAGKKLEEIIPETLEETLGLMEAVLITKGFKATDYSNLDFLRRGKLASLLKQLERPSKFSLEAYDDIWAEIFVTRLGRWERYKSIFDADHAKKQAIALLMQEEIARLGLVKAGKKYALLENPEKSLRRFKNSTLGKSLSTSLFNLPIALGMPPLALPRLSRLRLPQELADSLLDKGLTPQNLKKVDEFLIEYSAGRFGLNIGVRERYELIRKTYVAGLGIYFLILGSWEAVVRYRELNEEEDTLVDSISDIREILAKGELLEEQGYDIFQDSPGSVPLSQECRDLKDCLRSSLGAPPWDEDSTVYRDCRAYVDPNQLCKSSLE